MSLTTYLKKRGLTLDVLDYQNYLVERTNRKRNDDSEKETPKLVDPLAISKVYDKWLSEQSEVVQNNLPKHWSI